ncbi:MAG: hypothetical protein F4Y76_05865 [Acidimicrobiales bacterium]|nr:hypothetical protein [Acidimicrobiales bacterium]MYA82824.1 hypothetical protein [Acidimicrobiales bacterium]MYG61166.1 hypothetical protein [Acidimicrobiales bacterium]MYH75144.1 hypothetical protein [Acidimicrobiales bacterium]MYK70977.1 hypothetical protein [Acidimicrobiales bacterium]
MINHADLDALISRAAFRDWQSGLIYQGKRHKSQSEADQTAIRQDTGRRQQVLVEALARGPHAVRDFLCDMTSSPEAAALLTQLPALPRPLTEAEMAQTTFHVDREVSRVLDDWGITPMLAGESSFWALCHARWIGDEMFPDGVTRVFAGGEKTASDTEAMTRTFLRRVCGLPVERGNTSVITDCPLSAAWWRYRLAVEVSDTLVNEGEVLTVAQAHRVLQGSVVWETFVLNMIRRLASVNAPRARAAVVLSLHEYSMRNDGRTVPREVVFDCMQRTAQLGDRFSFALIDWAPLAGAAAGALNGEARGPA